ncbi:MAG: response regulator transcription factor [Eggerthellaceae bacterium]|nr:response regulator transcription factor [Eggerthellaceae bacterium]
MRILVVEDEANIVEYLRKSLKSEGFAVDTATDGNTALDMALSQDYDAITLDIMLPGMNGYDVCKEIRAAGITTPILMLTAKDGEYDEADAFDIGADDFLRKPFSLVVLVARLRALLRRGPVGRSGVLQVGDLTLNPATKQVERAGTPIELTAREFSLLEYLIHNENIAISKAQLLEHVWGVDFAADDNVVEVYIGYLRKKIDAPFEMPLIHTIRGVGYWLGQE